MPDIPLTSYNALLSDIGSLLEQGRKQSFQQVNTILIETCWNIGRRIVQHEQQENEKAEYGSSRLKDLARDLSSQFGKGFSKSNIYLMRELFLKYPKFQTLSGKLSWSHYGDAA